MNLSNTTLKALDLTVFRFDVPGSDDEVIQDVVYGNNITEAQLRAHIINVYGMYPETIEVARA